MESETRTPAQVYEQFFVPGMFVACTAALFEIAPLRRGDRVLDVACGTGVVARAATDIVGQDGRVAAIDLRPGMIEVANTMDDAQRIEWRVGDALSLDFDNATFDIVFCQQGVQFFSDRTQAMREKRRVLAAGGRVGIAVWQGLDRNDLFRALIEVEATHLATVDMTYEDLAASFLFGDPDALHALLSDAGFSNVQVEQRTIEARFPAKGFVANVEFGFSAVIPEFAANPAAFQAFVEAVDRDMADLLDAHRIGDEIVFPMGVNLARGVA